MSNTKLISYKELGECFEEYVSAEKIAEAQGFGKHKRMEVIMRVANDVYESDEDTSMRTKCVLACLDQYNKMCGAHSSTLHTTDSIDVESRLLLIDKLNLKKEA